MRHLPPGHGWAYLGVGLGLAASIAGNVANTVLTPSDVDLRLRVPFAVAWPIFLGIGIEVLTRVEWQRSWKHWLARLLLMGPMTLVAAFMSYLHLNHLMVLSGEPELAQMIGPLAVDGTLFGCTVALLVTRVKARAGEHPARAGFTLAERVASLRDTALAIKAAAAGELPPAVAAEPITPPMPPQPPALASASADAPVSPAAPVSPVAPRASRQIAAPRGEWDVVKAVQLLMEGDLGNAQIGERVNVGYKTIQRMRKALDLLRVNPNAGVPAEWKVPVAVIDVIRREVRR